MQALKDLNTILDGKADLLVLNFSPSTEENSSVQGSSRHTLEVSSADAKTNFEEGFAYAKSYELQGDYLNIQVLCKDLNLSASASMSLLGKKESLFYTSFFKDVDTKSVQSLISQCHTKMDLFEKLSLIANPTFMFCAGFLLCASRRFNLVLSGGIEIMAILLIANKIASRDAIHHDHRHLYWCTSENLIKQHEEAVDTLMSELDFRLKAYYVQEHKPEELK